MKYVGYVCVCVGDSLIFFMFILSTNVWSYFIMLSYYLFRLTKT